MLSRTEPTEKGKEWNTLDRFIAWLRYRAIDRFIPFNGIICDIGCGREAGFLKRNAAKIKAGYGFDFRQTDHKIGNITVWNNKNMNGLSPLDDCSCDAVFLIAVLEHLDSPKNIFSEVHRILKKRGKFIITTPTKLSKPILEFMAFHLHIINEDEIKEHKHYYDKFEIGELYRHYGFNQFHYKKYMMGMNSLSIGYKF